MFHLIKKTIVLLVSGFLLLTVLVNAGFFLFQKKLIYFPSGVIKEYPSSLQLEYKDVFINTPDSLLHGWEMPRHERRAYLLYFCGNSGNISNRLAFFKMFHESGFHVFAFDYPGFGMSTGAPSISSIRNTFSYISRFLNESVEDGRPILVYGHSLGGAVAVEYFSRYEADALILESTFTSIDDMARRYYPFLLVSIINREKYNSIMLLSKIKKPKLIMHAVDDDVIPHRMGRELYDAAAEPKIYTDMNGGHNNSILNDRDSYTRAIEDLLSRVSEMNSFTYGADGDN